MHRSRENQDFLVTLFTCEIFLAHFERRGKIFHTLRKQHEIPVSSLEVSSFRLYVFRYLIIVIICHVKISEHDNTVKSMILSYIKFHKEEYKSINF